MGVCVLWAALIHAGFLCLSGVFFEEGVGGEGVAVFCDWHAELPAVEGVDGEDDGVWACAGEDGVGVSPEGGDEVEVLGEDGGVAGVWVSGAAGEGADVADEVSGEGEAACADDGLAARGCLGEGVLCGPAEADDGAGGGGRRRRRG